jgi:hypothetical protein
VLVSDTGEYGLIIACKRLGIKLIEVQHGVFDAHHPDAIPVWAQGSSAQLLLPDVLACRGNYWIEQLTGTRQGRDHSSAVGSELIDIARDRRAARATGGPIRFVVSSQGLDSERLAEWLAAFVGAAPVNVKWELAIKLHPVYDVGTHCYDDLARDPHIRVVAGGALPNIYDLLVDADLHLSIASACHFDAAALGVPSGIIPLAGYETMLGAVDGRFFQVVQQPSDAWTLPRSIPVAAGFRFSAPGYRERLLRLVE